MALPAYEKLELLIDGEFKQGSTGVTEPVINPATGEKLGDLPHASADDLDRAIQSSAEGFKIWRSMTAYQRQDIMEKAARILEENLETHAINLTREMGKPLAESRVEIGFVINAFRWYGEEGKRAYGRIVPSRVPGMRQMVFKEPVGPSCAFVAWNFPGVNVVRKVAGALGAGCSMLIKASEETPGTCISIARALQEAGLPAGVLNCVFGVPAEVSERVLGSWIPRKVSFTGSVPVGKHLAKLSAETLKKCTMELGGHSPFIVFDDYDIDNAAATAAMGKFRNAGQVCVSPTRFYIQDNVYDEFTEKFAEKASQIKVGNGLDDGVQMGPLVEGRRVAWMNKLMDDAKAHGAEVLTGGESLEPEGNFYAPTVLKNVSEESLMMNEEPFGPLAPCNSFSSFDEVVERTNRLPVALSGYAFTSSGTKAAKIAEEINAGTFAINSLAVSSPETPFGGVNESGYGSEGGIEGLEAFQTVKFVSETGL